MEEKTLTTTKATVDHYSLRARLMPALLVLLPMFMAVAVFWPALYLYNLATGLAFLAVAAGLVLVMVYLVRSRGRILETKLFREWGARPTTLWLRHSDAHLDELTKRRYHQYFESRIPNWRAPTRRDEETSLEHVDSVYESAVNWLREHTRNQNRYDLVLKENMLYGFRRNTLGVKPLAIVFTGIVTFLVGADLSSVSAARMGQNNSPQIALLIFNIIMLAWWDVAVTKQWVKNAADAYARRLFAAIDVSDQ